MTAPRAKSEENGVDFEGGEAGSSKNILKIASRTQAEVQWINVRKIGKLNPTFPITCQHKQNPLNDLNKKVLKPKNWICLVLIDLSCYLPNILEFKFDTLTTVLGS